MRAPRWPLVAILAIGLGLAAAPFAFQMFTRAPAGGNMLDDFAPYMSDGRLDRFTADLATISAARDEAAALDLEPATHPLATAFVELYPAIHVDMTGMLADIRASIDEYEGVAALPPFALFPWFFFLPGLLLVVVATTGLRRGGGTPPPRPVAVALAALGVGLIAAPFAFQMFTRAPGGAAMIEAFEPLMQRDRVTEVQGYFLTIGGGEAELRNVVVPAVASSQGPGRTLAAAALSEGWAEISAGMAPMIGAMADNLAAFDGIAALPPFGLFPWFFVLPGGLVLALTALALRPTRGALPLSTPALEGA